MILKNKKGVIMGVANQFSIATGIAKAAAEQGAEIVYSHLPDTTGKMLKRVNRAVEGLSPKGVYPCDVTSDESIQSFFKQAAGDLGDIDFVVHSIAFGDTKDIKCPTVECSRAGFAQAMDISCYSYIAVCNEAQKYMPNGGSTISLSYYGGEKVVPGYNMMGICKSALEMTTRYLSHDLGPKKIRANCISAGPIKSLSASAISDFSKMIDQYENNAPLRRGVTQDDVGQVASFLLSDLSSSITGETLHVDAGYHVMGYFDPEA